jgi:hypothetical protein
VTYKPLTDEELSSDEGVLEETLFEQCRRANRLAEAVRRLVDESDVNFVGNENVAIFDECCDSLKAYLGEGES